MCKEEPADLKKIEDKKFKDSVTQEMDELRGKFIALDDYLEIRINKPYRYQVKKVNRIGMEAKEEPRE